MIGKKIRKVRELKGYSQEYMAGELGISQKTYSNIETDQAKVHFNRLEEISVILEISLIELLSFDDKNVFNNKFHYKVENNQNYVLSDRIDFEHERKAYKKHIEHLEKENDFLRQQLDKFIN
tara:strand:- start:831 stop:1196 length:366 start_codon:yes stop_codon:yes gene_type:complete